MPDRRVVITGEFQNNISPELLRLNPDLDDLIRKLEDLKSAGDPFAGIAEGASSAVSGLSELSSAGTDAASGVDTLTNAEGQATPATQDLANASHEAAGAHHEHGDAAREAVESVKQLTEGAEGAVSAIGKFGPVGAGAALALKEMLDVGKEVADVFTQDQVAETRLETALRANISTYEQYSGAIKDTEARGRELGFTDAQIAEALARSTPFLHNMGEEFRTLGAAENIARQYGQDVVQVTQNLSQAMQRADEHVSGAGRTLRQYGIIVKEGATSTQILEAAEAKYAGAAEAYSQTVQGEHEKNAATMEEMAARGGRSLADLGVDLEKERTGALEAAGATGVLAEGQDRLLSASQQLGEGPLKAVGTSLDDMTGHVQDTKDPLTEFMQGLFNSGQAAEESADKVDGSWGRQVPDAIDTGTSEGNQKVQDFADFLAGKGEEIAQTGDDTGKGYQEKLIAEIVAHYPQQTAAVGGVQAVLDIVEAARGTGNNTGAGYIDALNAAIAQGKAQAQLNVNSVISTMNAGIDAVNAFRKAMNLPAVGKISPVSSGGGGTDMSDRADRGAGTLDARGATTESDIALQKRLAPGYVDTTSDASDRGGLGPSSRPGVSLAEQAQNLKSIRDNFIDQYGWDPSTGETVDPEKVKKGKGGGGKGGGGKGNADKMAAAKETFDAAAQKYQQDMAQLALENQLSDAQGKTADAQKHKKDVDDSYATVLDGLNNSLDKNAKAEKATLAPLEAAAKAEQQAFDNMRAKDEAALHGIDVAIHNTTGFLKQMEAVAAGLEKPLEDSLASAQKAQTALGKEIAAANEAFQDQKDIIADEQRAFEQQAASIMGPLNDAYQQAQANVQALTDEYANKLLPITNELRSLEQQNGADDRAAKIEKQAEAITNLNARIAAAIPHSEKWNELVRERDQAEKDMKRGQRVDELTKEKEGIEAKRDAAIKAAQDEAKAAQKARDDEAKLLELQRQALAERMAAVDREAELYNRQARDKQQFAQQDVDNAQAKLDAQKKSDAAMEESTKKRLAQLQSERDAMAYNAQEAQRTEGLIVAAKNQAVADAKVPFETERDRIQGMIDNVKSQKEEQDKLNDSIIKGAQAKQDDIKAQLDLFKNNEKAAGIASAWADAQEKYATATEKLSTSVSGTAKAVSTEYVPAVHGMAAATASDLPQTAAQWQKYFAGPNDPGFDAASSIEWMLDIHNDKGFFGRMFAQWPVAFGETGLLGKVNKGLDDLKTGMKTKLDDMVGAIGPLAEPVGAALDGGIEKAITDNQGGIADALIAAVDNAIDKTKAHIESSSPSKLTGRVLGVPMGQGVGLGAASTADYIADGLIGAARGGIAGAAASMRTLQGGSTWLPGGTSIGSQAITVNIHPPAGMTEFPKDPYALLPHIEVIEEATRIYRGLTGKQPQGQPRVTNFGSGRFGV